MEILESQDPEKKRLIEASDRHKRALEKGVNALSTDTQKLLTNALIIGGTLALSYFIVRQLSPSGKSKKRKKKHRVTVVQPKVSTEELEDEDVDASSSPSMLADIGTRIANQATVALIDLARQKLMDYFESRKKEE